MEGQNDRANNLPYPSVGAEDLTLPLLSRPGSASSITSTSSSTSTGTQGFFPGQGSQEFDPKGSPFMMMDRPSSSASSVGGGGLDTFSSTVTTTDVDQEDMDVDWNLSLDLENFSELVKVECEGEEYLTSLEGDELAMTKQLEEAMVRKAVLKEHNAMLQAKVESREKSRKDIAVDGLRKKLADKKKALGNTIPAVEQQKKNCLVASFKCLHKTVEITDAFYNRQKEYRSPEIVQNSLNNKLHRVSQTEERIKTVQSELLDVESRKGGLKEMTELKNSMKKLCVGTKAGAEKTQKMKEMTQKEVENCRNPAGDAIRRTSLFQINKDFSRKF